MSGWTPGPWIVVEQGNGLALVEGPAEVHADRPYLRLADARLIAAAPEMAELLQAVAFNEHGSLQHWMVDLYKTDPYVKLLADKATQLLQRIATQGTDPE